MTKAPTDLRADVLDQAGQAWLLAGDSVRAYAAAGEAVSLAPGDPEIMIDRAEAAAANGYLDRAVTDLDRVLTRDPNRVDALVYRAAANRELDRLDPARTDIDKALALAPGSPAALLERGNIHRLQGDRDGARQDWEEIGRLAPGSPADMAARANIERLAKGPGKNSMARTDRQGASAMSAGVIRGPRRRQIIAGGMASLAGVAAARFGASSHAAETESLRRLAAAKGLIYGTTIAAWQITHDPGFIGLVEQQAGLVVPENDMKWRDINGGAPGQDDYTPGGRRCRLRRRERHGSARP